MSSLPFDVGYLTVPSVPYSDVSATTMFGGCKAGAKRILTGNRHGIRSRWWLSSRDSFACAALTLGVKRTA